VNDSPIWLATWSDGAREWTPRGWFYSAYNPQALYLTGFARAEEAARDFLANWQGGRVWRGSGWFYLYRGDLRSVAQWYGRIQEPQFGYHTDDPNVDGRGVGYLDRSGVVRPRTGFEGR